MSTGQVLIIDDEEKIARLLQDYLQLEGFDSQILLEGTHAVEVVRVEQPSFVILDLMLPGVDGLTICKEVRKFSNIPILMLTARVDEIDRLLGLELGADDYVCKPFSPKEVVARVKTILRRVQNPKEQKSEDGSLIYRQINLQPERFLCIVDGQELDLTPIEFRMLQALMLQPGKVFSREQLMRASYLDDRIVSDRTIDSHIKNLRRKLADALSEEEMIHSIYGVGYKME